MDRCNTAPQIAGSQAYPAIFRGFPLGLSNLVIHDG